MARNWRYEDRDKELNAKKNENMMLYKVSVCQKHLEQYTTDKHGKARYRLREFKDIKFNYDKDADRYYVKHPEQFLLNSGTRDVWMRIIREVLDVLNSDEVTLCLE